MTTDEMFERLQGFVDVETLTQEFDEYLCKKVAPKEIDDFVERYANNCSDEDVVNIVSTKLLSDMYKNFGEHAEGFIAESIKKHGLESEFDD